MLVRKKRRSPSKRGSSAWITRITVMDEGFKEAGEEASTKGDEKKKKWRRRGGNAATTHHKGQLDGELT